MGRTKPNDLRELKEQLSLIEQRRRALMKSEASFNQGSTPGEGDRGKAPLDREAAIFALTCVIEYLDKVAADASGLRRLLEECLAHPGQANSGDREQQPSSQHQESLQGAIAGMVDLRRLAAGTSARAAAEWVASNFPVDLDRHFSSGDERGLHMPARIVYAWYLRWSDARVSDAHGRRAYEMVMRAGLHLQRNNKGHSGIERLPSANVLRAVLLGLSICGRDLSDQHGLLL